MAASVESSTVLSQGGIPSTSSPPIRLRTWARGQGRGRRGRSGADGEIDDETQKTPAAGTTEERTEGEKDRVGSAAECSNPRRRERVGEGGSVQPTAGHRHREEAEDGANDRDVERRLDDDAQGRRASARPVTRQVPDGVVEPPVQARPGDERVRDEG